VFRGSFGRFMTESSLPPLPVLEQYDRYLRLIYLSNELLDDILPRIRRQLSLQTDQARLIEHGPTRGDIDWSRTIDRTVRETPGEAPVQFNTRLRRRSTSTPENTLVVAILTAYQRFLDQVQHESSSHDLLNQSEKQRMVSIAERVMRELAAPYAQALLSVAQASDIEALVAEVQAQARSGANAYADMITWWLTFRNLSIGRAQSTQRLSLAPQRSDEKTDAWMYELWIALECVHLLSEKNAIQAEDTSVDGDQLQFVFTWKEQRFRFHYNRQVQHEWVNALWQNAPGSRPDYTIEREKPAEIRHDGAIIWRESAVLLDAKYYLGGSDPTRTHQPIKKMLGDMRLLDSATGMLFFPLLPEPESEQTHATRTLEQRPGAYAANLRRDQRLHLYHLAPDMAPALIQERLTFVLDQAMHALREQSRPGCYGVVLDRDSTNSEHQAPALCDIVCPKPHIGPQIFDLVSSTTDCLKNPRLCHVMDRTDIIPPFVKRVISEHELSMTIQILRERLQTSIDDDGDEAEARRRQLFAMVGELTESFIKLTRADTLQIEHTLKQWVFGSKWDENAHCLSPAARNMLVSGEYVWLSFQRSSVEDWAAGAIQFVRALEHEMHRRMFEVCNNRLHKGNQPMKEYHFMFGTPWKIYQGRATDQNWQIILDEVVYASGISDTVFIELLEDIEALRELRNQIAHKNTVDQTVAMKVHDSVLGRSGQQGILPRLVSMLRTN
jgi:hypothetical protein